MHMFHWTRWQGSFVDALPTLQTAHENVTGRSCCTFAELEPIGAIAVLKRSEDTVTPSFPLELTTTALPLTEVP